MLKISGTTKGKGLEVVTSLVDGSVPFGSGGKLGQDNAQLFWDDTNNRLGIGTSSPQAKLQVGGNPGAIVGGFASGQLHITGQSALVNSNSVITGHNLFGGNKQLWYLGSTSSSNDNIAFINRQNGSLAFLTNNATRMTILAASNTLQGNAGMTLQGGSGVHTLTLSGGAGAASSISIGIASEKIGFFERSPVVKPTGVGVTTSQIHAALVSLGLIAA